MLCISSKPINSPTFLSLTYSIDNHMLFCHQVELCSNRQNLKLFFPKSQRHMWSLLSKDMSSIFSLHAAFLFQSSLNLLLSEQPINTPPASGAALATTLFFVWPAWGIWGTHSLGAPQVHTNLLVAEEGIRCPWSRRHNYVSCCVLAHSNINNLWWFI